MPIFTKKFRKQFKKLPPPLRERLNKKLPILLSNPTYPSFYSRKMAGFDHFEARLTQHYRLTYQIVGKEIWLLSIGSHDTGLGKK